MADLSLLEQLVFCTARIEATDTEGNQYSGTGFFYNFQLEGMELPFLITNRHVIKGMKTIRFGFSNADEQGNPLFQPALMQGMEVQNFVVYHPEEDVDLCAIPAYIMTALLRHLGKTPFFRSIGDNLIPNKEQRNSLEPVEEILLIGYPNGLWDKQNNMPIVRKGITATAPFLDYNGKKEFMIDASCFHGSSGSPVFLCNNGAFIEKGKKDISFGQRCYLLGILSSGPQALAEGNILIASKQAFLKDAKVISNIPNNLGIVISSERIWELKPEIEKNNLAIFSALVEAKRKKDNQG